MKTAQTSLLFLATLLILFFFFLLFLSFKESYVYIAGSNGSGESFLIVGIDTGGKSKNAVGGRTDYMALVYLNEAGLNIKSIPRDTIILYQGEKRKINSLLNSLGMEALLSVVEELTEREISGYVIVDFNTVTNITEFTGPIRVEVFSPMSYDDYQQDLHINFDTGVHYLEGEDLLRYLRYRHDNSGDLGRIERQKEVVNQILSKLLQGGPTKILELIDYVLEKTEISADKRTLLQMVYGFLAGKRTIKFSQINYSIDERGQIIPQPPGKEDIQDPPAVAGNPKILVVNNVPDFETKIGNFVEIIKAQWLKQAGTKVDATGIVPEIVGIEKRETYLFINSRTGEIREAFALAHIYHKPTVILTDQFTGLDKYYSLLDSLSGDRFYPSAYDALVLLGVGGK